jgi:hypothetical protein
LAAPDEGGASPARPRPKVFRLFVPQRKSTLALGVGLCLAALLSPAGFADEFTTFDFGDSSTSSGFGNFDEAHDVSSDSGIMNLYATAMVSGGVDVIGRIGATYTLNSGDLLAPFTAFTTTEGTAVGELTCLNIAPGTEASMNLHLQQWHQEGTNWVLVQSVFVDEWRCPLITLVDFEPFSGGGTFAYEPGETYRLLVEALARSRATNGSQAVTDFCDSDALGCGGLTIPGHIILRNIQIPNQHPIALFHDSEVWFVDALLNGAVVTGRACDIDGTVEDLKVWISEFVVQTVTPVGAVCGDGQHIVVVSAPGTFTGNAEGRDDENAFGNDVGVFRVSLLPPVQSAPAGFPDLGVARPSSTATLLTWLGDEGDVEAYRLIADGRVVADTTGGAIPVGHLASVSYDLTRSQASVVLDGQERWSGTVLPALHARGWWDVEPVALPGLAGL